jgi:hypothetical protein
MLLEEDNLQERWMAIMMMYGAQSDKWDYHSVRFKLYIFIDNNLSNIFFYHFRLDLMR